MRYWCVALYSTVWNVGEFDLTEEGAGGGLRWWGMACVAVW